MLIVEYNPHLSRFQTEQLLTLQLESIMHRSIMYQHLLLLPLKMSTAAYNPQNSSTGSHLDTPPIQDVHFNMLSNNSTAH